MKILLDTNAYVALKRGDASMARLVRRSEHIYFSAIVAGELLHGFRGGSRYRQNRDELEAFLERAPVTLLNVGWTTADRFARVALGLRRRGTPIPTNDIWIAAHAMESGAELVSYDHHFDAIEGLAWRHPAE